jgi:hypothetical protein
VNSIEDLLRPSTKNDANLQLLFGTIPIYASGSTQSHDHYI